MKIAVIITCFNRREKTVKCLEELRKQFDPSDIEYDLHLTDDGCTDGTAKAVLEVIPNAYIYKGGGLYWAGGMRLAWRAAYEKGGYDYFLFLNDDTIVNDNLVADFKECHKYAKGKAIISGAICDPQTGKRTYTGFIIKTKIPFKTYLVEAIGTPRYIDYSGANIMFIPQCIVEKTGFFPQIYVHGIADIDYCMRIKRKGFKEIMTSHYVGTCKMNNGMTKEKLKKMSLKQRYDYLFSPKGKASKQWIYYQYSFFPWRLPLVVAKIFTQLCFGLKE